MRQIGSRLPLPVKSRTMRSDVDDSLWAERTRRPWVAATFALLRGAHRLHWALRLTLSHRSRSAAPRSPIRIALGARPADIGRATLRGLYSHTSGRRRSPASLPPCQTAHA